MEPVALPIVPKRLYDEAPSSWLRRIGELYEVDPHSILDEWLSLHSTDSICRRTSIESRIDACTASVIAQRTRLPEELSDSLIVGPKTWVTESPEELPVCAQCLLSDDQAERPRYKRNEWSYCWRATCSKHGALLVYTPNISDQACTQSRPWHPAKKSALSSSRHSTRPRKSNHVKDTRAIDSIREIESAILRALHGRAPYRKFWGPIKAPEFLMVVQDVASFVLTNFSERPLAPICTLDVAQFSQSGEVACFARRPRPHLPWTGASKVVTLASVGDPGLRRCALFWVRDLMHLTSVRQWTDPSSNSNRTRRQAKTLNRQCSEGLAWLAHRMQQWPPEYRDTWWASTRILGLPISAQPD